MLNQFVIVGKIVKEPKVKETKDEKQVANIVLAVKRSFKNEEGNYDTDFIPCTLWSGIAISTAKHCNKGSIIGIKGRLTTRNH